MTQDQVYQLITILISVAGALGSFLVVFFKTRTKALEKKLGSPVTYKGKCILFITPKGDKYLIDLDEETILTKSEISFNIIKQFIDIDKEKKE